MNEYQPSAPTPAASPGSTPTFDATLRSRYECKYLIDNRTADAVRRYLGSHAALDPFSARAAGRRYRVLSLYLDSPGLQLYRATVQGIRNRYKLRLRYYAEHGDDPVFFEVKKRSDVVVRKSRARVVRAAAEEFLRSGHCAGAAGVDAELGEFLSRCAEASARPTLRVRYWREAWESRGVDPVRITFDTDVEHCMLSERGLAESRPAWRATPIRSQVVLEVKFTNTKPHWLDQMLHAFQLDKISVAKYAESIDHVRRSGQLKVLEARMGLADDWGRGLTGH